jgi:hypothetical protein
LSSDSVRLIAPSATKETLHCVPRAKLPMSA